MIETRRQLLHRMSMLAAVIGAGQFGSACAAAPTATSGPLTVVDLGTYRRGRSGSLPKVVRMPAQLVADKLVLPFDRDSVRRPDPIPSFSYRPGVYGEAGLDPNMPGTGERFEIGLVTEPQADWMMGGSPDNMLVHAEAHGSVPVHATIDGRVIDVLKHPFASFDGRGSKPYFNVGGTPVTPDGAHYPALSYVPYLATRDPYYLAELQFAATFGIIGTPPRFAEAKGLIVPWQIRLWAWAIRDVFAAWIATPEGAVDEPLLPKSYWKTILDNNREGFQRFFVDQSGPFTKATGMLPGDRGVAPWQQDYLSSVLGWMVWTGKAPEWRENYEFQVRQAVIRATGPLRSQAMQYELPVGNATTWPALLKQHNMGPVPGDHYPDSVRQAPHYPGLLRMSLKIAVMNKVKGADAAFTYADAEARRAGYIQKRHAV